MNSVTWFARHIREWAWPVAEFGGEAPLVEDLVEALTLLRRCTEVAGVPEFMSDDPTEWRDILRLFLPEPWPGTTALRWVTWLPGHTLPDAPTWAAADRRHRIEMAEHGELRRRRLSTRMRQDEAASWLHLFDISLETPMTKHDGTPAVFSATRPFRTSSNLPAKIFYTHDSGNRVHHFGAYWTEGHEEYLVPCVWDATGLRVDSVDRDTDLRNVPGPVVVRWLNVYPTQAILHPSPEAARAGRVGTTDCVACVRVEFRPGEGLDDE